MTDPVASPALLGVLDSERDRLPASLYEVGSMLSYHERGLLHWAARTAPPGAIVDLGSFLGGSTLALAAGAAGNDGIVDAFDRFRLEDDSQRAWIPAGFDLRPGDSTRDVFAHNTRRVADRVRKHEGEIEDQSFTDPIAVLFVDITKSWTTADMVWSTFLPLLVPGALLIQQDLVHWGHPWCAIIMEHLADHFDHLGWVWYSSAAYRCHTPVLNVPVPMLERLSCERMLELIDRAASRLGDPVAVSVRLSKAVVLAEFGQLDAARAHIAEVERSSQAAALAYLDEGVAYLNAILDRRQADMSGL